jgi:hypothetical protein
MSLPRVEEGKEMTASKHSSDTRHTFANSFCKVEWQEGATTLAVRIKDVEFNLDADTALVMTSTVTEAVRFMQSMTKAKAKGKP